MFGLYTAVGILILECCVQIGNLLKLRAWAPASLPHPGCSLLNRLGLQTEHQGGAGTMLEIGPIRNQNLIFWPLANNLGKLRANKK